MKKLIAFLLLTIIVGCAQEKQKQDEAYYYSAVQCDSVVRDTVDSPCPDCIKWHMPAIGDTVFQYTIQKWQIVKYACIDERGYTMLRCECLYPKYNCFTTFAMAQLYWPMDMANQRGKWLK